LTLGVPTLASIGTCVVCGIVSRRPNEIYERKLVKARGLEDNTSSATQAEITMRCDEYDKTTFWPCVRTVEPLTSQPAAWSH